jgi:hypothetical protein
MHKPSGLHGLLVAGWVLFYLWSESDGQRLTVISSMWTSKVQADPIVR